MSSESIFLYSQTFKLLKMNIKMKFKILNNYLIFENFELKQTVYFKIKLILINIHFDDYILDYTYLI
jgi:hypothetical protein